MTTGTRALKPMLLIVLAALLFVALAIGATVAKKMGVIDTTAAKRIGLITFGLVLVVAGNFTPKMRLFENHGFPPARAIAAQRLSGWALAMAGLAVIGFWIFSATRETLLASSLVGLGAFGLMGAAWLWLKLGPRVQVVQPEAEESPMKASAARHAFACILFGLFCAFGIFFVDYVASDDVSQWSAIFVTLFITSFAAFGRKKPAC